MTLSTNNAYLGRRAGQYKHRDLYVGACAAIAQSTSHLGTFVGYYKGQRLYCGSHSDVFTSAQATAGRRSGVYQRQRLIVDASCGTKTSTCCSLPLPSQLYVYCCCPTGTANACQNSPPPAMTMGGIGPDVEYSTGDLPVAVGHNCNVFAGDPSIVYMNFEIFCYDPASSTFIGILQAKDAGHNVITQFSEYAVPTCCNAGFWIKFNTLFGVPTVVSARKDLSCLMCGGCGTTTAPMTLNTNSLTWPSCTLSGARGVFTLQNQNLTCTWRSDYFYDPCISTDPLHWEIAPTGAGTAWKCSLMDGTTVVCSATRNMACTASGVVFCPPGIHPPYPPCHWTPDGTLIGEADMTFGC